MGGQEEERQASCEALQRERQLQTSLEEQRNAAATAAEVGRSVGMGVVGGQWFAVQQDEIEIEVEIEVVGL